MLANWLIASCRCPIISLSNIPYPFFGWGAGKRAYGGARPYQLHWRRLRESQTTGYFEYCTGKQYWARPSRTGFCTLALHSMLRGHRDKKYPINAKVFYQIHCNRLVPPSGGEILGRSPCSVSQINPKMSSRVLQILWSFIGNTP